MILNMNSWTSSVFATLDGILIHSNNLQDHCEQVKAVLKNVQVAEMFVKPEKCEFEANKTTFLGFVISQQGIEMDLEKVCGFKLGGTKNNSRCLMLVRIWQLLQAIYRRIGSHLYPPTESAENCRYEQQTLC